MDRIEKMFADISPEDFIRDTSAIEVRQLDDPAVGRTDFDEFVEKMLNASRALADDDENVALSVLSSPTERRTFCPDDDETPDQYANRLRREADVMGATWFFNAMTAPGRAFQPEDDVPEISLTDAEQIRAALRDGTLSYTICWSAILDEDSTYRRGGIILLDEDGHPQETVEGDLDPDFDPFRHVLGGD